MRGFNQVLFFLSVLALSGCAIFDTSDKQMFYNQLGEKSPFCHYYYEKAVATGERFSLEDVRRCAHLKVAERRSEFLSELSKAEILLRNLTTSDDPVKDISDAKSALWSAEYDLSCDDVVIVHSKIQCSPATGLELAKHKELSEIVEKPGLVDDLVYKKFESSAQGKPINVADFYIRYAAFAQGRAVDGWINYLVVDKNGNNLDAGYKQVNEKKDTAARYTVKVALLDHVAKASMESTSPELGQKLVRVVKSHNYEYDNLKQELATLKDELRRVEERNREKASACANETTNTGVLLCSARAIAEDETSDLKDRQYEIEDALGKMGPTTFDLVTADYRYETLHIRTDITSHYLVSVFNADGVALGSGKTHVADQKRFSVTRGMRCDDVRFFNAQGQRTSSCDQSKLMNPTIEPQAGKILVPELGFKTPSIDDDLIRHVKWNDVKKSKPSAKK